jgi:hypothetical protein
MAGFKRSGETAFGTMIVLDIISRIIDDDVKNIMKND